MKKKILTLLLIMLLITMLCLTLVGCVGTKYDFSKFFAQDNNYSIDMSYTIDEEIFSNNLINQTYLTGCLYELEYKSYYVGNNQYVLYNAVERKTLVSSNDSNNRCEMLGGSIDLVVCYSKDSMNYKYFLPDGQLLYSSSKKIDARVYETSLDDIYNVNFDGTIKVITLADYGYKISDGENQSLNVGSSIGVSTNEYLKNLKEKFGLGKNYSIDITDYNLIVMKNKRIVASCDLSMINDNIVATNNASILYFERNAVPADSEDYNVIINGNKYNIYLKSINLKTGKTKDLKTNYVITDIVREGVNGDVLVAMQMINKDKTLNARLEYFVLNGKGIVANVDKSFATMDDIYTINSKEFIVQTDRGLYLTDKYLNVKKDFTQVQYVDVFANEEAIVAKQKISNKYKYGVIDLKGKVTIPFIYDSYKRFGSSLHFESKNDNNVVNYVYDVKNLTNYKKYEDVTYMGNGVVLYNDKLIAASTGQTIMSKTNLNIIGSKQFMLGKSEIYIIVVEYNSVSTSKKVNVIGKVIKNTIEE